jgi:7-cyano-7-deazaguanine tRNA-ribosyltransferase
VSNDRPTPVVESVPKGAKYLTTRSGKKNRLPMFYPVYQPQSAMVPVSDWKLHYAIEACIVNGFFLYKNRETRAAFEAGQELHRYLDFDGVVMTDSGAFQGLTRQLFLENKTIVAFQDMIGADVISPLDLITPPGDKRTIAEKKSLATTKRIKEAFAMAKNTLAGVQQGGRFLDLRRQSVESLMEIGVEYLAIGSLVPFFNKRRNLKFVGDVLRDARRISGPVMPMHVYGAGDPVELPFLVSLGADIFDSASYGHYAADGWYMTAYGAIQKPDRVLAGEYRCECHICRGADNISEVFAEPRSLAAHNLWTIVETIQRIRRALEEDRLPGMLAHLLETHMEWFPDSELRPSWELLHG